MSNEPSQSSGLLAADTAVCARPCIVTSVILEGDGTNAASVILYDNASAASGTVVCKLLIKASSGVYEQFTSDPGIVCQNGIYADVAGTGAKFIVHYKVI